MMGNHSAIQGALRELGICASMRTILIQKGYFVGYKYCFDGGYAVRMVEKNAIEVYDDDGNLLKTVSLAETDKKGAA